MALEGMKDGEPNNFTPTYNRGYLIQRCYESLCRQSNKNFVWLIVDDGSTDNTEQIINSFIKEKKIKIIYFKQKIVVNKWPIILVY